MSEYVGMVALALAVTACERSNPEFVAEVNREKIPAAEFKERYAVVLSTMQQRDNIKLRQQILDHMINERLILADLARRGMDRDSAFFRRMREIEGQALLDRYARKLSTDTLTVSAQELADEFTRYNTKAKVQYVYALTEAGAVELKRRLAAGETFEQLAREVFDDPGLAHNGGDIGYVGWGDVESELEEFAFSQPLGMLSDPIKMRVGYAIARVRDRWRNPLASEFDFAKVQEKLERAVRQRKALTLVRGIARKTSTDMQPRFNEKTVDLVFRNWQQFAIPEVQGEKRTPVVDSLSRMLLVNFSHQSWTVAEFLGRLASTSARQRRRVKTREDLKEMAKGFALRDVMLRDASDAGLKDDPDVVQQVRKNREFFLLDRWAKSVQESVGQDGLDQQLLEQEYEKNRKELALTPEANVAEILVKTNDEAVGIARRARAGENFGTMAARYSLRRSTAKRGGEIGFGTRATFGNLGEAFLTARIGAIIGPEFVDPYFGVFKIVDKHEGRQKTFAEARPQLVEFLTGRKKQEAFARSVGELRSRATVVIHTESLAKVVINEQAIKDTPP